MSGGRLPALIAGACGLLAITLLFNARLLAVAPLVHAEEHYTLGQHLHRKGILSIGNTPACLRPPGFPALVAVVLHARDALFPDLGGRRAVALAQGWLLGLAALALFLYASRQRPVPAAFAVGALYVLHPLNLALARALTYPALHIAFVTIATLGLSHALQCRRRRAAWALAAGLLWGATTLVRPVSLILPPFVLLLARWEAGRGSWRRSLGFALLFSLGMALVIGPYTLRNYRVSGRLIVVNAQEGFAIWGLSATRNPTGDIDEWMTLWKEQGDPVFRRLSGTEYTLAGLYEYTLPMNDAFRAEAGRNIRRDPGRYALNVLSNLYSFNADSGCWWLDYLRFGSAGPRSTSLAKVVSVAILLLGLAGVVFGLRRGETQARVLAVLYAMFCVAHGLGFLLSRYNYVRLPLALLAIPLLLPRRERWGGAGVVLLLALLGALASWLELSAVPSAG